MYDGADWPSISLLSGSPSRTTFPRGFLWDEGFHQLIVNRWNQNITMRVLADWMSAQYSYDFDKAGKTTTGLSKRAKRLLKEKATKEKGDQKDVKRTTPGHGRSLGGWIPREMVLGEEGKSRH